MSKPILAAPVADPISIDPGVNYSYNIVSQSATAFRVTPNPYFALSFAAPILSVKFIGAVPDSPTTYPITITLSNSEGAVSQTLNFRVGARQIAETATKISVISDGTSNIKFTNGVVLAVGDVVLYGGRIAYYVFSVDSGAGTFQLATGTGVLNLPITPNIVGNIDLYVAPTAAGSDKLWVGDTTALAVNQPIRLGSSSDWTIAPEAALLKSLFVKQIVDACHIKVSSSIGGSAISATVTSYTRGKVTLVDTGSRQYPNITSAASLAVASGGPVSYAISCDIAADSYAASGLPGGLSVTGSVITGIVPAEDKTYAVALSATKDGHTYTRYLQLTVGSGSALVVTSTTGGFIPGAVPTSDSSVFYDGDYTMALQAGAPEFVIPFKIDPKPYIYRLKYWQFVNCYRPATLGDPGPFGGVCAGEVPGSFKDVGGGIIEFEREFCFRPANREEWESFVYSYQFLDVTSDTTYEENSDGNQVPSTTVSISVFELPLTVQSRIEYEYTDTEDPQTIALASAPRLVSAGSGVYDLHGYQSYAPGDEFLAEDETMKRWSGNIYERKRRYVIMQSLGQIVA